MRKPQAELLTAGGTRMVLGRIPRVVGTLTSIPDDFPAKNREIPCDVVEVRLDAMPGQDDWLERCTAIERSGMPVILTIRLAQEGGKWVGRDEGRLEFFKLALKRLSAVDVEYRSRIAEPVAKAAKAMGKVCIFSYHDFGKTPSLAALATVVSQAQKLASVVKVTTMVKRGKDLETLRGLLARRWKVPVCVMGMGAQGTATRISFPTLGSCLTYGYLDEPIAPGQSPAGSLVASLRAMLPKYNEDQKPSHKCPQRR
jgi:3-dehydroquinate dehydratase-1